MGSAWATFIGYGVMMILSYFLGQKYYLIPYDMKRLAGYPVMATALFFTTVFLRPDAAFLRLGFHLLLLFVFVALILIFEKKELKGILKA